MRLLTAVALASAVMIVDAQAACKGPTRTVTGPNGKTKVVCLDGKHSTCMRDSMSLGHSREAAKRFCDSKGLR
jgi:hypothetical protein